MLRIALKVVAGLLIVLLLFLAVLHAPFARKFVLGKVQDYLSTSQGIDLRASQLNYNLARLSLSVKDLEVRSLARSGLPPFLRATSVSVKLDPWDLLSGLPRVEQARIEGLNLHVAFDREGNSNLPSAAPTEEEARPSDPNAPLGVLISALHIEPAALLFEDAAVPVRVGLPGWRLRIAGDRDTLEHRIAVETTHPGEVAYENRPLAVARLLLDGALQPGAFTLSRAEVEADGAKISASATVRDFNKPETKFTVGVQADTAPLLAVAGIRERAGGSLNLQAEGGGLIDDLRVSAQLRGEDLYFRNFRRARVAAAARYAGKPGQVELDEFSLNSPYGNLSAQASASHKDASSPGRLSATLRGLDLDAVMRNLGLEMRLASRGSADLEARWKGLDAANLSGQGNVRLTSTRGEPVKDSLPVDAQLAVRMNGDSAWLTVESASALGSVWEGELSVEAMKRLGGELSADVSSLASTLGAAEKLLGEAPGAYSETGVGGSLRLSANLGGTVEAPEVAVELLGSALSSGPISDAELTASAAYTADALNVPALELRWKGQSLRAWGNIGLTGHSPALNLEARIADAALQELLAGLGSDLPVAARLNLEASVKGTVAEPDARLVFSGTELHAYGEDLGTLTLRAGLSQGLAKIETLELLKPLPEGQSGFLRAQGEYDTKSNAYRFQARAENLRLINLTLPEDLAVRGALNLDAEGAGTVEEPGGNLNLRLDEVRVADFDLGNLSAETKLASGNVNLRLAAPRFNVTAAANSSTSAPYTGSFKVAAENSDLSLLGVNITEKEPLEGTLSLRAKGVGDLADWKSVAAAATIERLVIPFRGQELRNQNPLRFELADGRIKAEPGAIRLGDSTIRLAGWLPVEEPEAGAGLHLQADLDLAGLLELLPERPDFKVDGLLTLAATAAGSITKPEPSLLVRLPEATVKQEDLSVKLAGLGGDFKIAPEGTAEFAIRVEKFEAQTPQLNATTGLRAAGRTSKLEDLAALRAEAQFEDLSVVLGKYELRQSGNASLALSDGRARIDRFVLAGPKTEIEAAGSVELTPGSALDLRLAGNFDAEIVSLFAEGVRLRGDSQLVLAVSGDTKQPTLHGYLETTDAQAHLPDAGVLAEALNLRVAMAPERITLERLEGTLNGGTLRGSGVLAYAGSEVKDVRLNILLDGGFFNLPEGLKSQVSADLNARKQDELILVGGKISIQDAAYRDPLELEGQLLSYLQSSKGVEVTEERNPLLASLRFNIAVETANPVLVDNNLAKLAIDTNLRLVGSFYRPSMIGRVTLEEGGQIFLNERKYFVERGVVTLLSEAKIDPYVDLLARTKAAGFDINLQLTGGTDDFTTTFTSDPPLSQPDIISVLLTGRTLDQVQGAGLNVAREQAFSYVSGRAAGRVSRGLQQKLGLSQVRIEPNLIAAESHPGARLTLGQDFTDFLRLIYSMNLADSRDQIYIAEYDLARRFVSRAIRQSDNTYRFEFRHDLRLGGAPDTGRPAVAPGRKEQRVGRITIEGEPVLDERLLLKRFNIKPRDRYDFHKVQQGIERLGKFYADRGYLEARVRVRRSPRDEEREMDLALSISAGPVVQFAFEGYSPSDKLRKQVRQIWNEGFIDAQRTEDSVQAIREHLVAQDLLAAEVTTGISRLPQGEKQVLYRVESGVKYSNVETVFEGAEGLKPGFLSDTIEEAGLADSVYTDPSEVVSALVSLYREYGFLEAKVSQPRYELDASTATGRVIIAVKEGPEFKVGELTFSGNRAVPETDLRAEVTLAPGTSFRTESLNTTVSRLEEFYWTRGYNDVVINYALQRKSAEGQIDLDFRIIENRQEVVRDISIEGRHETSEKFVRNQLTIGDGEVLDFNKTNKSRRNLYGTGAYALVDIQTDRVEQATAAPETEPTPVDLRVSLREVKPFDIRYGAFFDTDRGPGFIADFANRNTLGAARVVGVRTRYDSDIRELRGYFSQPLLRRLPLKTNVVGFVRREIFDTFITDRTGFSFQQETYLGLSTILSYGYRFERTNTFDKDPESLFKVPPFNVAPLTFSYTRETRDEFLDATRGSFISHALEYSPEGIGSDIRFVKYFGQYFKYFPLSKPAEVPLSGGLLRPRWVFVTAARAGLAKGLGGQNLIRTERFFAGGGTTMRGFEQNTLGPVDFLGDPAGGDAVFILNNELRFPLAGIFEGVGFLDLGNVYTRVADFNPFDARSAAGFGLRVRTPYFLLRLDYGLKLKINPGDPIFGVPPEKRGAFFFSIGQAF